MQIKDKPYYIYLHSNREHIPCTEKEFHAYYHDIDLFRQKQQYRKQCVCPQKKRLECDMDCQTCPFRRNDAFSLDKPLETAEGEEMSLLDSIPDESPLISEIIANKDQLDRPFRRLKEIMPDDAFLVGQMCMQGQTDTAVSKLLKVKPNTLFYRLKRAREIIEKEFPDFFDIFS